MEATDQASVAGPSEQSIEKGIFLTHYNQLVHRAKVRVDLGVGICPCGPRFIIGDSMYIGEATFGNACNEADGGEYKRCPKCASGIDYSRVSKQWRNWKYIMRRTLKKCGFITD